MLSLAAAAFILAAYPIQAQDAPLPEAETVLDRYVEATGGKAAHEKLKSYIMNGSLEVPAQGMKAKMTIYRDQPSRSLAQIDIPGMGLIEEGYNGSVAWSKNPMQGARIKQGSEKEMAAFGAASNPDSGWREIYSGVKTVAEEVVNGAACYKLELKLKSGMTTHRWFDKKTHLLAKTSATVDTPNGAIDIESFVSDFRKVGDVLVPHKVDQKVMAQEMTLRFDSIEANAKIDPAKFELPAEVKALLQK